MKLPEGQRELCDCIYKSVRKQENIDEIVREVTKDDFFTIFTAVQDESRETLLGTFETASVGHLKAVLNRAKELGLLKEFVREKILSSKNQDKMEYISLIECITDPSRQCPSEVLRVCFEVFTQIEFFSCLETNELEEIQYALERELENETDKTKQQNLKKLIVSIGDLIENRVKAESDTGKINQKVTIKGNKKVENKLFSPTSKAVVAGAICGVIAGLAVGGGLFAAGAQLSILALIGIAVAAAIVTGLIIGVNTHATLSKPSNELNEADTHQQVPQTSKITA